MGTPVLLNIINQFRCEALPSILPYLHKKFNMIFLVNFVENKALYFISIICQQKNLKIIGLIRFLKTKTKFRNDVLEAI